MVALEFSQFLAHGDCQFQISLVHMAKWEVIQIIDDDAVFLAIDISGFSN
jgi:hypothetical protein